MKILKGKVAIVTGSASGIGKEVALLFGAEGARVVVSDVNESSGAEVVKQLHRSGHEAIFVKADTSSAEDNENLVRQAVNKFGALHIAVNNAGIAGPLAPIAEYPVDGWKKVIDINLSGIFYGMRFQIPAMIASGGGSIVNVSSILGSVGTRNASAYVSAKHGIVGLTKVAALEYADQKIRVNSVGPAYIKTPLLNVLDDDSLKAVTNLHPIGRLGEAREVAEMILWLGSDKASFATGGYYPLDGGYLSQ